MITEDKAFRLGDKERLWNKYCGFLDLSISEFMEVQEQLLMKQIELVCHSPLGRKLMPEKPISVSEFRSIVPLTTYDDYDDYLRDMREDALAVKPSFWGHTSGRGSVFKWVPCSKGAMETFIMLSSAMTILACANKKYDINIGSGVRMLQNLPPPPYMTAIWAREAARLWDARLIPPLDKYEDMDFATKIEAGFRIALRTGVDTLSSMTSVLLKMGERFTEASGNMQFSFGMLHPRIMWHLILAWIRSKREGRSILPKDLWPLKGLICYGTDTAIYREQIKYYWGKEPYEVYAASEAGMLAFDAWNKKNMTFTPTTGFLEFIPESEWMKNREDSDYQPSTVLLNEVKPGSRYEIIVTNFYGMPFLRYRLGDLIKVVAMEDKEAGIKLPQVIFDSRADDLIDIGGFPRLDEKTIWQAINNKKVKYEEWTARKEYENNGSVIRLYLELKEDRDIKELEGRIHEELVAINTHYRDLENMLGIKPLRLRLLPKGSFQHYYEEKQKSGVHLAHLKPRHMNAPDAVIEELLKLEAERMD